MSTNEESKQWLEKFIQEHAKDWDWGRFEKYKEKSGKPVCTSIDELIVLVENYITNGVALDGWCFDNDEVSEDDFWYHYNTYTGKEIDHEEIGGEKSFIQCCC